MFSLERRIENVWAGNVPQWLWHCSGIHEVLSLIPQPEKKYIGVLIIIQGIFLFLAT